ncbi:MAG: 4Fe-4S binding protein [Tannerellaceae bacterium]|jgi:Na+-translocating ferredoxin:NAD+ oxidoreductase RNF subunit RnfB|nr:4Fe-4S binding protein [Tannerellaceae bacterium]
MTTYIITSGVVLLIITLSYFRNKRAKSKIIHVIENNCIGCRRCVKKCRHKALEMATGEVNKLVTLKYPDRCTACKDCIIVCKCGALELVDRKYSS